MKEIVICRSDLLKMASKYNSPDEKRAAVINAVAGLIPKEAPCGESQSKAAEGNGDFAEAFGKIENFDPGEAKACSRCCGDNEDYSDFFNNAGISYLMYAAENVTEDTAYLGEVFGVGDDKTGCYYLLCKNESFDEACSQKDFCRVGLILPPEMLLSALDNGAAFSGYDFCGAYVNGEWQFYKCGERMSYMTFSSFGLITNLFSRNEGLFESEEMLKKYAVIIGCGSVGSHVALQLARAGISKFILIDGDILKLHNVCRHRLGFRDLGRYKTAALKDAVLNINPLAEVVCFNGYLQDAPAELFNLGKNGIMVGTADNRSGNAVADDLAEHLGIPFVAIGCWARAAAGEVFYQKPGCNMPSYREAYRELIDDSRPDAHSNYFGDEAEQALLNFEPGTSVDIEFVSNIGIKVCLDLLCENSNGYTPRVIKSLTNCTLICNTNNPKIGGENVAMFPYPLFISRNIYMRRKDGTDGIYGKPFGSSEKMEND